MYINIETKELVTETKIRKMFPNRSFPAAFVAPEGFAEFRQTAMPEYDQYTQKCVEGMPSFNEDGTYSQTWIVQDIGVTPLEVVEKKFAIMRQQLTLHADRLLNKFAKDNEFDNINTMISYRDSGIEDFRTIGQKAFNYRDAVWAYLRMHEVAFNADNVAYAEGSKVPPTFEEIIAGYPKPEDIL